MKCKTWGVWLILAFLLGACSNDNDTQTPGLGADVTSQFLETYAGVYQDDQGDVTFEVGENGDFVQYLSESPSDAKDNMQCQYVVLSKVTSVYELDDYYRKNKDSVTGKTFLSPRTHALSYRPFRVILTEDESQSPEEQELCWTHHNEISKKATLGRVITEGLELLDNGTLRFHNFDETDYTGQVLRPASTLDEVYIRR